MEIPAERLKAIPNATLCAICQTVRGDVPKIRGYMSWAHKTAPEIIIGKDADILRQYDRRGFHAQLPLNSKENPRLRAYVTNCNVSDAIREKPRSPEPDVEAVLRNPSRCHPKKPRINPAGDCLDCALAKQKARLR